MMIARSLAFLLPVGVLLYFTKPTPESFHSSFKSWVIKSSRPQGDRSESPSSSSLVSRAGSALEKVATSTVASLLSLAIEPQFSNFFMFYLCRVPIEKRELLFIGVLNNWINIKGFHEAEND